MVQPKKLQNTIVVTHASDINGPPDALMRYLKLHSDRVVTMRFPLSEKDKVRPSYDIYVKGDLVKSGKSSIMLKPFILNYMKDMWLTFYWSLRYGGSKPVFFGCNNLLSFVGLILKFIGKVKRHIFYTIDYSDTRFGNKLLNDLYLSLDRLSARRSDAVWSNTDRTREIRRQQGVAEEKNILVPNGVFLEDIPNFEDKNTSSNIKLQYTGYISEGKGIDSVIKALELVHTKLPELDFSFDIRGYGPYEETLKAMIATSSIKEKINFVGRIPFSEVMATIGNYDLTVALINAKEDYIRYCDPMKVKESLACGVPVLISNVPEVAIRIRDEKMGIVVEDSEDIEEIADELIKVFKDKNLLTEFRNNIGDIRNELDWSFIFGRAIFEY